MTKFYNPVKWISTLFMFYLSLCYSSAANYLCFTSKETGITIKYIPSDKNNIPDITYSYDQEKWFPLSSDELILMLGENEKVYLRGKNPNGFSFSSDSFTKFSIDGNVEVSGSVMSLIDNEGESTEIPNEYCFYRLFEGCKIISAPELPATSLKPNCYRQMFWGCPIEKAPELPATKLAKSCYAGMMGMCLNLEETPELPATELADSCYSGMFTFCSNLKKVVNLPAPTLAKGCYIEMFSFCSQLNYIKVGCPSLDYNDGSDNILSATKGWVQSIDGKGYFIFPCGSDYDTRGASAVPDNFDIIRYPITIFLNSNGDVLKTDTIECGTAPYYGEEPPFLDNEHEFVKWDKELNVLNEPGIYYYTAEYKDAEAPVTGKWLCFTAEEPESVVFYKSTGDNEPNVFYSYNGLKWYPLLYGEEIKLTNIGDKVYVKGNNPDGFSKDYDEYTTFFMYGSIAASGSVMSLIDGEGTTTKIPNDQCFINLFEGCQSLTTAPELPATELTSKCYSHMFDGCVSLREAPKLPATTLEIACYESMFSDCISLKETPELPATNLASACYADMFARCTSITKAYDLPAEKLASTCYMSMFIGCSSLVEAPALPAIVMESYCYSQMFLGCTSLTKAPELPATTLETACYDHMFGECSSLKYIKVGVMSLDNEVKATYNWVNEVDEKGLFIFPCGSKYNKYGSSEVPYNFKIVSSPIIIFQNPDSTVLYRDTISCDTAPKYYGEFPPRYKDGLVFKGWDVEPHVHETPDIYYYTAVYGDEEDIDLDKILCFTAEESNCTISYNCLGNPCPDLQFSVDSGKTWKSMEDVLIVELENVGDKVYVRGNNPTGFHNTKDDYFHFTMKGLISASGSVMSLLDMKGELTEIPCDYCFNNLFINCPLTQAPDLPATVLTKGCYKEMFKRCYFLQKAPELPAETVKDESYEAMFNGCSSLSEMPKLPATTLGKRCYYEMFVGCTNLTKAYDLPAKKLETACYAYMFTACSKLEEAPALPATELADSCYCFMFLSCENLTKAPELPATTLKTSCYDHMFTNCQNLETVPDLKATVVAENCCNGMFLGCTYLRKAPALPAKTLERNCYYTMFAACVNLKEAPELPATTLAEGCYNSMFGGCMKLEKAPELPATNLADECYSSMFAGCTSLNYIKVGLMTLDNEFNATDSWVGGVEGPGVFVFPCGSKYNKHGASEVPNNFKIVSSPIVIFQNPDSTVLYSDTINCGDMPSYEKCDTCKTPYYGDDLVFINWDKELEILNDPDVYYYTAVYEKKGNPDIEKMLCFTAEKAGSNISYTFINKTDKYIDVQYSIDGGESWHKLDPEQKITLESVGDKVYFKGNNPDGLSTGRDKDLFQFKMNGAIAASGSIMSLIDGKGATTVIPCNNCFESLFSDCGSLTQAPELPATVLTESCYKDMFRRCYLIFKTPDLPSKDLAKSCYKSMFYECFNIRQATELPATKLAEDCYSYMFEKCNAPFNVPELPATELAIGCYSGMFKDCSNITQAPELPATKLANDCYYKMFEGCSSLTKAPDLPAKELKEDCYAYMFNGCENLNYIKVGVMSLDNEIYATDNWVDGVNKPGTFIFPCGSKYDKHGISEVPDNFEIISSPIVIFQNPDSTELYRDTISCDTAPVYYGVYPPVYKDGYVFKGWDVEPHVHETPGVYYYTAVYDEDTASTQNNWLCFTAEEAGSEVWYYNVGNNPDVQYSLDGGKTWKTLGEGSKVTLKNIGDKVYFKGNNPEGFSHGQVERSGFKMSGLIKASGSVMSLVDGVGKSKVIPNDYCFSALFNRCEALTQAPELPATTLTKACYEFMFQDCINLTEAPKLPATKIYDKSYVGMFMGCSNLKEAPALPATEMKYRCYDSMFRQCTSLETPPALPAKELAEECYLQMFYECSNLKEAPELPANKMAKYCYSVMFTGCENLKIAPKLPATELAPACYSSMFSGCIGLTEAPELPATELAPACYSSMFGGCIGLTEAPELPATKLDSACYSGMFYLCSALTEAPELPATTLAEGCYSWMFDDCSSLIKAPALPATELAKECYMGMFMSCTSLEKAPELPATEFADSCYIYMFKECTNLNYIKVGVMTLDNEVDATKDWVEGVDEDGTFIFPCGSKYNKHGISEVPDNFEIISSPIVIFQNPDSTELYRDTISCDTAPVYYGVYPPVYKDGYVFKGWDVEPHVHETPGVYYYTAVYDEDTASTQNNWLCFTAEEAGSEVWYYNVGNNPDVQYSLDGGKTWKTLGEGSKVTLKNIGDKVYFKGNNPEGFSHGQVERSGFKMSGLIKASGSVMSLVDGVGKSKVIPNDYCFSALFNRCEALTQAPELPATTLTKACYEFMFQDCINLTEAPKLPATKIYDKSYVGMFMGCSNLKEAPALPATEMKYRCYDSMFRQCTSLETPPALPAKELAEECYHQMFHECYSLNVAPELPATKMANDCYSLMLNGCIKLTTAPKLPATELAPACYYSMFGGCIGLTEAPELPATKLDSACYSGMFYLCSALTEAPELPATTLAEGCYSWMFDDCSSLIKAPALPATELAKECYMGMFLDCTSLEKVPELPATKLAKGCYMGMFMSCTSLEKAPELPATEFADSCYIYMFKECTNLNYIKVGVMTLDNEVDATKDWVEGVDGQGTFIFPCGATYDKHGYSEVPPLFEIIGHGHINDSIIIACDSIVFDGITYYESKEWNDTISTIDECDSIIAYHLIVNKSIVKEETIYADQSFIWHDMIYTEDASWDDSLTSVSGCDSVIRYNLIINKSKLNLDVRDDDMILILPGDEQPISYILTGGKGSQYEIRDKNKLVCSGEVANDSSVNLICPNNMEPGLHTVTMEMCDEEGNCAKDEFEINVMKPDDKQKSYYVRVWNDVVICRNGDGQFLSYQWYKDGKKVEDASLQYFNDISVLDGEYMVFVSDKDGKSYFIEPIHYEAIDAAYSITATPGIVDRGKEFTLTITGVEANDLQNARIVVYRVDGTIEKILNNVEAQQSTMQLRSGDYVIVLTVNDGKNANCKVLVK